VFIRELYSLPIVQRDNDVTNRFRFLPVDVIVNSRGLQRRSPFAELQTATTRSGARLN
jgi:hypothetical protein